MSTIRQEQIQSMLVSELSDLIRRDLRDPKLSLVTLTGAQVSRDLKYARVFVSSLDPNAEIGKTVQSLQKAAGFMRGEFTRRAGLRVAPEITFEPDQAIERGSRIFELLQTVQEDLQPDEQEPATGR